MLVFLRRSSVTNSLCAWQPDKKLTATKAPVNIDKRFSTGELPVVADRYRFVWGRFCPWAAQSAIAIDLQGLDTVISKGTIQPVRRSGLLTDWVFGSNDNIVDPVLKTARLSENYKRTDSNFKNRATVPALVDVQTGAVVNNNANDLLNELTGPAWETFRHGVNLVPAGLEDQVASKSAEILRDVNRASGNLLHVTSQTEYEQIAQTFFQRLSEYDHQLATHPYLLGAQITQADVRLFVTLVRWDLVYAQQNKLNFRRLNEYSHLWAYAHRLYHQPAFERNTDFEAILAHFYHIDDSPVTTFDRVIPYTNRIQAWKAPWANRTTIPRY